MLSLVLSAASHGVPLSSCLSFLRFLYGVEFAQDKDQGQGKAYRAIFIIEDDLVLVTHVRGPGQDIVPPHELP